ncbi:MAG: hypothetical protein ABII74_09470 [Elusimicrobiota bacterium]
MVDLYNYELLNRSSDICSVLSFSFKNDSIQYMKSSYKKIFSFSQVENKNLNYGKLPIPYKRTKLPAKKIKNLGILALAETSLKKIWLTPEEDEVWKDL